MTTDPTTAQPHAAPVEPAEADQVKRLLSDGLTVQQVADRSGWPREHVLALINGIQGWRHDPATDTVLIAFASRPCAAQATPRRTGQAGPADQLLADAGHIAGDDPTVCRELERAQAALTRLQEAVTIHTDRLTTQAEINDLEQRLADARTRAEREITDLEKRLADARTRAEQLASMRPTTPVEPVINGRPADRDIRAWAKAKGIPVNTHGKVHRDVVRQYLAAHGDEPPGLSHSR